MADLNEQCAIALGWTKQFGMPLWYEHGDLIRNGAAWGALPDLAGLRSHILRAVKEQGKTEAFMTQLGITDPFALLSVTPAQIARAFLALHD